MKSFLLSNLWFLPYVIGLLPLPKYAPHGVDSRISFLHFGEY